MGMSFLKGVVDKGLKPWRGGGVKNQGQVKRNGMEGVLDEDNVEGD